MAKSIKTSTVRSYLSSNVRYARLMLKWTQEDLAASSGLHTNQIGLIERSDSAIKLNTLCDLGTALGVDPWVLLQPPTDAQPKILNALKK